MTNLSCVLWFKGEKIKNPDGASFFFLRESTFFLRILNFFVGWDDFLGFGGGLSRQICLVRRGKGEGKRRRLLFFPARDGRQSPYEDG